MNEVSPAFTQRDVQRVRDHDLQRTTDALAVEEPLEIRVVSTHMKPVSVSVTMRTPGHDDELALGFLWSEGVIANFDQIESVRAVGPPQGESRAQNIVQVNLKNAVDFARLNRNFYTTSSCGVCGKASLNAVAQLLETIEYSQDDAKVSAATIHALPQTLRASQNAFEQTGGLHAAALFDASGNLIAAREDVGRHNALDKLLGSQLLQNDLPLHDKIVLVSGRASFELVQKTLMAGAPIIAAVGAPSSLAVDLAKRFGLTLLGFVRDGRFNIYSGFERII